MVVNYNFNDLLHKHKDKPSQPTLTVPKKDVTLVLPYLGLHSDFITRRLKSCVNKFYGFVNLRVVFQNTRRIKSFFPYKDRFNRSQKSKIVYKASCWDYDGFYIGKTIKEDYMTERLSTSKLSLKLVTPPLLLSIRFPLVTTSIGTILRSEQVVNVIYSVKSRIEGNIVNTGLETRPK